MKIRWKSKPEEHDYPAAFSYLSLLFKEDIAKEMVKQLKRAEIVEFHAKDIFRAAALPELPKSNYHVKKNIRKMEAGEKLSPLLLVRHNGLIIADGYHRLCSVYIVDEDAMIPGKIA